MRPLTLTNTKTKVFFKNCTQEHATTNTQQRIQLMLATTIQLPNTTPHHPDGATTPSWWWGVVFEIWIVVASI
jgi:hypothetical protein